MPTPYHIGLDVGTTATKACAFTTDGKLIGMTERGYPLLHPAPGAAVQESMDILHAAEDALADLVQKMAYQPAGVGLSCPMHSLILCDEYEVPATEVITWADVRAEAVMADFSAKQRRDIHQATGTPVHPMSPLVKLRWLLKEHPQLKEDAYYCYDLKAFLTKYWTNTAVLDEQVASASGMYDAAKGEWHLPALAMAGRVAKGEDFPFMLPPVKPADYELAWNDHMGKRLGLTGVPLFVGGSDGVLANFGSGILSPGEFALSVGTSGAVRTTHSQATVDPDHGLFNYKLYADRFAIGGATNNGGKVLEYWQGLLSGHFPEVKDFVEAALSVPAEEAPTFQPWLYGERAPIWDAAATAQLSGLRGHHTPAHIARAVLDGVTNNIVDIIKQLEAVVGPAERIQATGGITKSPQWLKLLADRCGREVVIADSSRATALGAAMVSMGKLTRLRPLSK
jgi:gluconokinase